MPVARTWWKKSIERSGGLEVLQEAEGVHREAARMRFRVKKSRKTVGINEVKGYSSTWVQTAQPVKHMETYRSPREDDLLYQLYGQLNDKMIDERLRKLRKDRSIIRTT